MSTIKVTVHGAGAGNCSLTGKSDVDGLTVTFDDGTVKESFLSWKSFRQLLALKTCQGAKIETKLAVPTNGPAIVTPK